MALTSFKAWLNQTFPAAEPVNPTVTNLPCLVIGAGPAGLAAAKALRDAGIAFEQCESHDSVGGLWHDTNPRSPAYQSLITNSSKATTTLGPAMESHVGDYPSRKEAHQYLVKFSESEKLLSSIRFNSRVEKAVKTESGAWDVTTHSPSGTATTRYRALILASGKHSMESAVAPQALLESAKREVFSVVLASQYREPSPFRGKAVLIVGLGNSAADIAAEVSQTARRTIISYRRTPWIAPLYVGKTPSDVFVVNSPWWLPRKLERFLFSFLQRKLVGHPASLGFSPPQDKLLDRLPISNRSPGGLVEALKQGRVVLRSPVSGFSQGKAFFERSQEFAEPIDAVIFATGYQRQFCYLPEGTVDFRDPSFKPSFLIFHPTEPGLLMMNEAVVPQSCWPIFTEQAKALAAYLTAESRSTANAAKFNQELRHGESPDFKRGRFSHADQFHVDPRLYSTRLREFSAWIGK